jgi:uncharacterized membrane protein
LQRPGISLPMQGTAISILMMVTFAAFRLYNLIPSGMAFALLFLLTTFTCLLAILQNALWLAIFGISGGFAAPLLTSTGSGNYIGLFSYYALLNAGVFGIALFRSWRSLNLIGFVFTFLVGTAFGVLKYVPENYLPAQGFLILFFLFYVAIALIYATKEAPKLKNYVDATLVFGTPLLAFSLQYNLVKSWEFGVAFSCMALGLFYIGLALALWRKRGGKLQLLIESFLALGLVFGTLALPFALDGRWTSAAWALEGAGVLWVGLRQRQALVWSFGLLVQAGAWLSFLSSIQRHTTAQTNLWLGFLLLSGTAFLVATSFRSHAQKDAPDEPDESNKRGNPAFEPFATLFLAGASIWLLAGAWVEIFKHTSGSTQASLIVFSGLLIAILLVFLAKKMQWVVARHFALLLQILAGLTLLHLTLKNLNWPDQIATTNLLDGPFLGALMIGAAAFFSARAFLRQSSATESNTSAPNTSAPNTLLSAILLAWAGFWWFGQILHSFSGWLAVHYQIANAKSEGNLPYSTYYFCAYSIVLALSSPFIARLAQRWEWPNLRWGFIPAWLAMALATVIMLDELFLERAMPAGEKWCAFIALWLASEWLMRAWQNANWPINDILIKSWHFIRSGGPWLMIWPVGAYWIGRWLAPANATEQALLQEADWITSASWARYIPMWIMMAAIAWLARRIRANAWPVQPLTEWYQGQVLPLATGCSLLMVAIWNFTQNGTMQPLPYLPLLNPLDLTTGFAFMLALDSYRLLPANIEQQKTTPPMFALLPLYVWFNLILLRTATHVWDIPYRADALFDSNKVQAMLSLVWTVSALILMRFSAQTKRPQQWIWGAVLLGVVVIKLFAVDQTSDGGVERIIAFVGVGLLMLVIAYFAPYPKLTKLAKPTNSVESENLETDDN